VQQLLIDRNTYAGVLCKRIAGDSWSGYPTSLAIYSERLLIMKVIATIYSLVFVGVALWAWYTYFPYKDLTREQLLPGIALNIVSLPSSLLMERIVGLVPWILDSLIAMLSITTGLGAIQVLVVWLIAIRFKFPGA